MLNPIWTDKTETATRVRQRIEAVIDFAKASGDFAGDNPAAWNGNLEGLLPNPSKLKDVKHQPALPYKDMSEFMALLQSKGVDLRLFFVSINIPKFPNLELFLGKWQWKYDAE